MMAAPLPAIILARSQALGLTTEQVGEIEGMQKQLGDARDEHATAMNAAGEKLVAQVESPKLDLAAYESALRSLADERVAMSMEYARIGQTARDVLTAEQQETLRAGMRNVGPGMSEGHHMGPAGSGAGMSMDSMMGGSKPHMMGGGTSRSTGGSGSP
ncbi:MAG: Spy/CpxP family protein refolding chaperone [Gemmatimonadota bacterium]